MKVSYYENEYLKRCIVIFILFSFGFILGSYYAKYLLYFNIAKNTIQTTPMHQFWKGIIALLPILLSYLAFLLQKTIILLIVVFLKGLFFSYCFCGLCQSNSGWISALIVQFSDFMILPVVIHFWMQDWYREGEMKKAFVIHLIVCAFISLIDNTLIIPILNEIKR